MREVIRALRQGEAVAFLADQDAGHHGVFVEFFRCPASTSPGPAAIAVRWGIPIILCFNVREEKGRYRFVFERIPIPDGPQETAVESVVREYSRRLEVFVRAYPEQWLWLHRRWKTKQEKNYSPQRTRRKENGRGSLGEIQ
jgi:KDO2-lipid IV(A) lauroyltransferase